MMKMNIHMAPRPKRNTKVICIQLDSSWPLLMATEFLIGLAPLAMNSISRAFDATLTGKRISVSSPIFWVDQLLFDMRMRTTPTVKLILRAMLASESAVTTNSVASLLSTICESTLTLTVGIVVAGDVPSVVEGLSSGASNHQLFGSCSNPYQHQKTKTK